MSKSTPAPVLNPMQTIIGALDNPTAKIECTIQIGGRTITITSNPCGNGEPTVDTAPAAAAPSPGKGGKRRGLLGRGVRGGPLHDDVQGTDLGHRRTPRALR